MIIYKIETKDGLVFEGDYETSIDVKILEGSSCYHGTAKGSTAWRQIREEIVNNLPVERKKILSETFKVASEKPKEKLLEKQKDFEAIFNALEPKIGNPKISGKWLIYERLIPKAFNNTCQKAKDKGFKSAFYRDEKIGVLLEELK